MHREVYSCVVLALFYIHSFKLHAAHAPTISLEQSCNDITVYWSPSSIGSDPSSYNVSVWSGMTVVGAVSVVAIGTMTYSHTFTGLRSDVLYMVKVIASNCAGSNATIWTCK